MSSASPTAARSSRAAAVLVALMAASVVACGPSRAGSMTGAAPAEACLLTADDPEGRGSRSPSRIEMGLAGEVNPAKAPVPGNADEALLLRLLYEPLVRIDCTGRRYPGLASGWQASEGGRTWTFVLREDARFWNGDPVRAGDVVESWEAAGSATVDPWRDRPSPVVEVLDERRLEVTFSEESSEVPAVLARTELATVRRVDGSAWPVMGTGPYRVADAWRQDPRGRRSAFARPGRDSGGRGTLELERVGGTEAGPATVRVRIEPGGDGRDLLAAGVDLLVTDDPRTLDYASIRPGLSALPLPWSRTYVLAIRTATDRDAAATIPGDFLEDLARDVVRSEARPIDPAATPGEFGACLGADAEDSRAGDGSRDTATTGPETRIVHLRRDRDAAAIARRLVALATSPSVVAAPATDSLLRALGLSGAGSPGAAPPPVAAPVDELSLPDALLRAGIRPRAGTGSNTADDPEGDAFAYVVGVPRTPWSGCPGGSEAVPSDPQTRPVRSTPADPYRMLPLVDTRRRAIVRSSAATFTVDGDATLFFAPAEGGR